MITVRPSTSAALPEWKSPWTRLSGTPSPVTRSTAASTATTAVSRSPSAHRRPSTARPSGPIAAANAAGIPPSGRCGPPAAAQLQRGRLAGLPSPAGCRRARALRPPAPPGRSGSGSSPTHGARDVLDQQPALVRLDREHGGTVARESLGEQLGEHRLGVERREDGLQEEVAGRPSAPGGAPRCRAGRTAAARPSAAGPLGRLRSHPGRRAAMPARPGPARPEVGRRGARPELVEQLDRPRPEDAARRLEVRRQRRERAGPPAGVQPAAAGSVVTSVGIGSPSGTPTQRGWVSITGVVEAPRGPAGTRRRRRSPPRPRRPRPWPPGSRPSPSTRTRSRVGPGTMSRTSSSHRPRAG